MRLRNTQHGGGRSRERGNRISSATGPGEMGEGEGGEERKGNGERKKETSKDGGRKKRGKATKETRKQKEVKKERATSESAPS